MRYGTIVSYFPDKKFGFIRPDDGQDIFFHITALGACETQPEIKLGQAVKYELSRPGKVLPKGRATDGQQGTAERHRTEQPKAELVELIDKLPGAKLAESAGNQKSSRHRRARQKKPTWRK